jgi:hypothetical protein
MSLSPLEKIMLGMDIVPVQTYDGPIKPCFRLNKKKFAGDIEEASSTAKAHCADMIGFDGCGQRRDRRLIVTAAIFAAGIAVGLGGIALTADTLHQFQLQCSAAP